MKNNYGLPELELDKINNRNENCVYCSKKMLKPYQKSNHKDSATIEHLNYLPPWNNFKTVTICCGSCNSSRGKKTILAWFNSKYCLDRNINLSTVLKVVKDYIAKFEEKLPEESLSQLFADKHRISLKKVKDLTPEDRVRVEEAKKTTILALFRAGMGFSEGLPMGWKAKEEIEEVLVLKEDAENIPKGAFISEANYTKNLELLTQATGVVGKKPDFEMFMSALSQTPAMEESVRDELVKIFSISHHTTLGHKALAHLFKYRIIKTIINFIWNHVEY